MCLPAAAALLLAALAALPCRGTDTNSSTILNENRKESSQPLINKIYQMLHTSSDQHNETKLTFNSPVLHNFETNTKFPTEESRPMCCQNYTNRFTSEDGAIVNDVLDKERSNRMKRVLNIIKVENVTLGGGLLTGTSLASPIVMERKRKSGEAGSSAPLLNYIFDTYSNTHYHRNEKTRNGNSIYVAAASEIEALVGSNAHMDCKVDALHDKLVSWVRRKSDEEAMELLTTGTQQYTADDRYSARFIPPDIWRLEIKEIRETDAAFYDCQLSAHPPRTARVTLRVPEISVRIIDGAGASVSEQVCELGSTVALRCEVRGLRMEGGPSLLWYKREALLNDDTTRGGISVRTEFGANGANSVLRVARVRSNDAGRYTCSIARTPPPSPAPAHVILHVIKGESLAELHQGVGRQAVSLYLVIGQIVLHSYYVLI